MAEEQEPAPVYLNGQRIGEVSWERMGPRIREEAFQRVVHPERYGIPPTPAPHYGVSPLQYLMEEVQRMERRRPSGWLKRVVQRVVDRQTLRLHAQALGLYRPQSRRQRAMRALRTMLTRQEAWACLFFYGLYAVLIGALGFWAGGAWVASMMLGPVIAFHVLLLIAFTLAYRREGQSNG